MPRYFDLDQYTNDFKAQFEETTGKSIEELQNEYKINQLNAFGSGNSFQKINRQILRRTGKDLPIN